MSGWMRLKNTIGNHPKHLQVTAEASWLWACGIGYCRENLTDGFIPAVMLPKLGNFPKPVPLAAALVRSGLWSEVDGGYLTNDYAQMNLSKREVQDKLDADAKRKREWRNSGVQSDATSSSARTVVTDTKQPSAPISSLLITHCSVPSSEGGVGETPERRLWEAWRDRSARLGGVIESIEPKHQDLMKVVEAVGKVPDEAQRLRALDTFWGLDERERQKRNIKLRTFGYFVMALGDLLADGGSVEDERAKFLKAVSQ